MAQIILFNPSNGLLVDSLDYWPPWALLYISIKLHNEYSIKIIDERIHRDWKEILDKELTDKTICVGATSLTGLQLKFAAAFLKEVKRRKPKVKTVMGGNHVTSIPIDSAREPFVDFIVRGDGETTFYNLVKAIEKSGPCEDVKGIVFKGNLDQPLMTPPQEFENLEALGDLPLHLVEIEKHISKESGLRKFIIFTSRGCPFGCTYCYNSNIHNKDKWRAVSARKAIDFIKALIKYYGINYFVIQDDNFWVDKKRVEEFVRLIEEEKLDIKWAVYGATIVSLKYITPEIAQRLKRSGLQKVLCGIESVSPKVQKIIGKIIKMEDFYQVDKIMGVAGIKMIYSFMCGFPGETDEDIKMNIDAILYVREHSPNNDAGNIKPIIFYPGTALYDWAVSAGFKSPKTFEEWSNFTSNNYDTLAYPWLTKKRKEFFLNLYFTTLLLNPDYEYIKSKMWKYFAKAIYPVTKWRVKRLYFKFSPVLLILRQLKKLKLI